MAGGQLTCIKTIRRASTNITVLFIIYENFDHALAEHYPVTLIRGRGPQMGVAAKFLRTHFARHYMETPFENPGYALDVVKFFISTEDTSMFQDMNVMYVISKLVFQYVSCWTLHSSFKV